MFNIFLHSFVFAKQSTRCLKYYPPEFNFTAILSIGIMAPMKQKKKKLLKQTLLPSRPIRYIWVGHGWQEKEKEGIEQLRRESSNATSLGIDKLKQNISSLKLGDVEQIILHQCTERLSFLNLRRRALLYRKRNMPTSQLSIQLIR